MYQFRFEPALIVGFIRTLLYALVLFGLALTEAQILGMIAVFEAAGALFVRSQTVTTSYLEDNAEVIGEQIAEAVAETEAAFDEAEAINEDAAKASEG